MVKNFVALLCVFFQVSLNASASEKKVWLFQTHLVGAMNQRLGVAKYLNAKTEIFALPDPILHLTLSAADFVRDQLGPRQNDPSAWPDFILHTEPWPEQIEFLMNLKKMAPKPLRVVYLENPGSRHSEFDLIVNSIHYPLLAGENWIRPLGVASWITAQNVDQAKEQWSEKLKWLKSPSVFVAIGGGFDHHPYQPEYIDDLSTRLLNLIKSKKATVIIATSRRTPGFVKERLTRKLTGVVYFLYDWESNTPENNPYLAGLILTEHLIVTGDSISMMSDAIFLGKGFYIHAAPWSLTAEPPRMIEDLYIRGMARPFVGDELKSWTFPPVNVAADIANEIKRRFCPEVLSVSR